MASSERFGYEWHKYDFLLPQYEEQFLKWTYPLTKESFKNKVVLDAGCGMGRNSYWPLKYGAKRVLAFDADKRSVAAARRILSKYDNATVINGDINEFETDELFDYVLSIGVIHHLHNPRAVLKRLSKFIKTGGKILIWVYGYEGNEWIVKLVNPIRKYVTSRLPVSLVHVLSYLCSIPLLIIVKLLPVKNKYLLQLKGFSFRHMHSIVFDQLIPEVANYWTREEAEDLFSGIPDLKNINSYPVNQRSWTVVAEKI